MDTIKIDKMKELKGSVITVVHNAFAGCETLKSVEEAKHAANNRVVKGLTAMTNSGVFSKDEVEYLSDFATGYIAIVEDKVRQRVVEALRDQFEF